MHGQVLKLDVKLCGGCGGCVAVCPVEALELFPSELKIKNDLCNLCRNCMIFCPTGALSVKAEEIEGSSPS